MGNTNQKRFLMIHKTKWKKIGMSYDQMTFLHNLMQNEIWISILHENDITHINRFLAQGWYNNKRDSVILKTLRRLYLHQISLNPKYKIIKSEWL